MSIQTQPSSAASFDVQKRAGGVVRIAFAGRMDTLFVESSWEPIRSQLSAEAASELEVDVSAVEFCEGSGMSLLHSLLTDCMTPGAKVTLRGLKPEFQQIFNSFSTGDLDAVHAERSVKRRTPEETGLAAMAVWHDLKQQVTFLGHVAAVLPGTLFRARQRRWTEVMWIIDQAGVNALPIVALISFLVGLIIAFEAAQPLAQFGAQIFIANMMGLLMVRELGPLMTGIMLAGRSGSAFAAELGTMKVNEELNALETMGLDPVGFLVVQRIAAGVILAPVLTVFSMLAGIIGGTLVMTLLGFPMSAILAQLAETLTVHDMLIGTLKGMIFGGLVASVGCLRGLQTKKGPSAVGESTTRAVVTSILLIIIADAMIAVVTFVFGG